MEETFEIRNSNGTWRISYPDEGDMETQVPVYDKEGNLKTIISASGSSGKLFDLNEEFLTVKEAIAFAKDVMGAENIRLVKPRQRRKKKSMEAVA